jgi:hypothetical protein
MLACLPYLLGVDFHKRLFYYSLQTEKGGEKRETKQAGLLTYIHTSFLFFPFFA